MSDSARRIQSCPDSPEPSLRAAPESVGEPVRTTKLRQGTPDGLVPCLGLASFWQPAHMPPSAWLQHAPFAFWLMSAHQPRLLVELGTHHGFSYLAFCQAVDRLGLDARCFAVDTWEGDEHTGFYDDSVLAMLRQTHDKYYSSFSELLRCTFDEALAYFVDNTIDLLHIDGRHTYEDVKHDFESWHAKLSSRALVLFHDTNVRERNFGVFRQWEEIRRGFPSFEFVHGHGLGVLGVGPDLCPLVRDLLTADPAATAEIRAAYARLGAGVADRVELTATTANLAEQSEQTVQLRSEVAARSGELADLKVELGSRQSEIGQLQCALAELAHEAERLRRANESLILETERLQGESEAEGVRVGLLSRELDAVAKLSGHLSSQLAAQQSAAQQHAHRAERLDRKFREIKTSLSWQVTKPLRAARRAAVLVGTTAVRPAQLLVLRWALRHKSARRLGVLLPARDRDEIRTVWRLRKSQVFDEEWYLTRYPEVRAKRRDPVVHYVRKGAARGYDPHPAFNTAWYLRRYPDVAQSGINPLLHYVLHGMGERRAARQPEGQDTRRRSATSCRIECAKPPKALINAEVALLVTHSADGEIKPHVARYVELLREQDIKVVLIVAVDRQLGDISDILYNDVEALYVRENRGFDFAAWAHVLQVLPMAFGGKILYLINDSVLGPVNPEYFDTAMRRIRAAEADVVGMTSSTEDRWHLQSYFLALKSRALKSWQLQKFFCGVEILDDKQDVIEMYEQRFAQHMRDVGLCCDAVFELDKHASGDNPTTIHWRQLLALKFPFLKLSVARGAPGIDNTGWREALGSVRYDLALADFRAGRGQTTSCGAKFRCGRAPVAPWVRRQHVWPVQDESDTRVAFIGP